MGWQRTVGVFYATGKLIGGPAHLLRVESLLRLDHSIIGRLLLNRDITLSLRLHHTRLLRCKTLECLLLGNPLLELLIPITHLLRNWPRLRRKTSSRLAHYISPCRLYGFHKVSVISKSLVNINWDTAQRLSIRHLLYSFQPAPDTFTPVFIERVKVQAHPGITARIYLRLIENVISVDVHNMRFP